MPTSFQEFFDRLRQYTPIQNQSQLAQALDVGRAAITLAKGKDIVPSKWILDLAQKYSLNSDWLASGQGNPHHIYKNNKEKQSLDLPMVLAQLDKDWQFESDPQIQSPPFQFDINWLSQKGNIDW